MATKRERRSLYEQLREEFEGGDERPTRRERRAQPATRRRRAGKVTVIEGDDAVDRFLSSIGLGDAQDDDEDQDDEDDEDQDDEDEDEDEDDEEEVPQDPKPASSSRFFRGSSRG